MLLPVPVGPRTCRCRSRPRHRWPAAADRRDRYCRPGPCRSLGPAVKAGPDGCHPAPSPAWPTSSIGQPMRPISSSQFRTAGQADKRRPSRSALSGYPSTAEHPALEVDARRPCLVPGGFNLAQMAELSPTRTGPDPDPARGQQQRQGLLFAQGANSLAILGRPGKRNEPSPDRWSPWLVPRGHAG